MSDVGLSAALELDTRRALQEIDQLEQRLATITRIQVDAETSRVTSEITAAVEAADTQVTVEGDAREVTSSIDSAVEAADDAVAITGTASGVTGAIDAAVDAADTTVEVAVDVDARGVQETERQVRGLRDRLDQTEASAGRLRGVLATLGAAGVARGIYEIVQAASDLNESSSKAATVFGDSFGQIEDFAEDAAAAVGLSRQEALEATGTFGNLFQALGLTREAASDLSPDVVTLAADLASFNNLGVDDALEKLRSGLIGEIEPLRSLGVSFGAAEVEAKALELGLVDATGAISEGAKVQARYELILEQTTLAQGDFARTSEGLANQQRILGAEFRNMIADVGQGLLPQFLDLVGAGRDLIPVIGEFAERTLPPLLEILTSLVPLGGSFLQVLTLLAPVIEVVASAIDAIPDPLLIMLGTLVALNSGVTGAAGGVLKMVDSVQKLGSGLLFANPAMAVLTGAVVVAAGLFAKAAAEKAAFAAEVKEATEALRDENGVLQTTNEALAGYIEEQSALSDPADVEALRRMGLTFEEVAALSKRGADGVRAFVQAGLATGDLFVGLDTGAGAIAGTADEVDRLTGGLGLTNEQLRLLATGEEAFVTLDNGSRVALGGNEALLDSFRNLIEVTQQAATDELARLAVTDEGTAALVARAEANNRLADGTVDTIAALAEVNANLEVNRDRAEAHAAEQARVLEVYGAVARQYQDTGAALGRLADASPEVASEIRQLRLTGGDAERGMLDLAVALDEASLSEEQLGDVAALVGTDVESLQGFVEDLTGALDDFVETATGQLPTVGDAFADALRVGEEEAQAAATAVREQADEVLRLAQESGDELAIIQAESAREAADAQADAIAAGGVVTAAALTTSLQRQAQVLRDFRGDLQTLTAGGFADIAAIIAEQGPEVGGQLADELATALEAGNVAILDQVRLANDEFQAEWTSTTEYFRTTLGPEFILTSGLIGEGAAAAFGENLTFEERIRIAAGLAATGLDQAGQAVAAVAAAEGDGAARAYGDALGLDRETIDAAVEAGRALRENAPTEDAREGGKEVGRAMSQGVSAGIREAVDDAVQAAREIAFRVRVAAGEAIEKGSPSRLFAREIGEPITQGIAAGILAAASEAVDAVDTVLTGASLSARTAVDSIDFAPEVLAQVAPTVLAQAGAPSSSRSVAVTIEAGAFVFSGDVTPAVARQVVQEAADLIADTVDRWDTEVDVRVAGPGGG